MPDLELSEIEIKVNQIIKYLIRWNIWILLGLGIAIVFIQYLENPGSFFDFSIYHYIEIFLFLLVLSILSSVIIVLSRTSTEKVQTTNLLNFRHELSLKLAAAKDMAELSQIILEFPITIVPSTTHSTLLIYYSDLGRFEWVGEWSANQSVEPDPILDNLKEECHNCLHNPPNRIKSFEICNTHPKPTHTANQKGYCIPLMIDRVMIASLHFSVADDVQLTREQKNILDNTGTEIAIAIKSMAHQQRLAEIKAQQAAIAERNQVFQDLHDVIGQNLAYLRMKLDQYSSKKLAGQSQLPVEELIQMRDVASVSYEIFRGSLKDIRSSTTPYLSGLLNHHSKLAAIDGKFRYHFSEFGSPQALPPMVLHYTYFICKEAINNIARHSHANEVQGKLTWGHNEMMIEITDDGQGFDINAIDSQSHYGLSIMRERVERINGQIDIQSIVGLGTKVTICIPINQVN